MQLGLVRKCNNSLSFVSEGEKRLKWKPPHENSVDFKLKLEYTKDSPRPELILCVWKGAEDHIEYDRLGVTDEEWEK